MLPWNERPFELAYLLNPAFISALLVDAVVAHLENEGAGIAYPLLYLVPPLVLHHDTRGTLPRNTRRDMTR